MITKVCTKCGEDKPIESYYSQKNGKYGKTAQCKLCTAAYDKERGKLGGVKSTQQRVSRKPGGAAHESYMAGYLKRNALRSSEYTKNANLKKYGLTLEEFGLILEQQDGKCLCCGKHFTELSRGLHVDHDHGCCGKGKACVECRRGLICHACNTGIGSLGDNIEGLEQAISYLKLYAK